MCFFCTNSLDFFPSLYLGIVPPVALWAVWMGKKVKSISKEVQNTLAETTELAEEKISNIRTVR